jgi:urocanate hydratase
VDVVTRDLEEAVALALAAKQEGRGYSVGLIGNQAEVLPTLLDAGLKPDVVTDQTSAHDPLNGYVPGGMSLEAARELREASPERYLSAVHRSIGFHVRAMLAAQRDGAVVFDYGNNIRGEAVKAGVKDAFNLKGFVREFVRPMFEEGRGPFRWIALTGEEDDIRKTDSEVL